MQHISWFIQYQINEHLKLIQDELYTLTHKEAKDLLISIEYSLELKQRFKKTLNETIEAYNQNLNNIKSDEEALAKPYEWKLQRPWVFKAHWLVNKIKNTLQAIIIF